MVSPTHSLDVHRGESGFQTRLSGSLLAAVVAVVVVVEVVVVVVVKVVVVVGMGDVVVVVVVEVVVVVVVDVVVVVVVDVVVVVVDVVVVVLGQRAFELVVLRQPPSFPWSSLDFVARSDSILVLVQGSLIHLLGCRAVVPSSSDNSVDCQGLLMVPRSSSLALLGHFSVEIVILAAGLHLFFVRLPDPQRRRMPSSSLVNHRR